MSTDYGDDRPGWQQHELKNYAFYGKIMVITVIVLIFMCALFFIFHVYARPYILFLLNCRRRRRRRRRRHATPVVFYDDTKSTRGLKAAVLKSLPVFTFSSGAHTANLECTVCLSEFEENDSGRILPKCEHSFHTRCIDVWFRSHSTCPICRSPVEAVENDGGQKDVVIDDKYRVEQSGSGSGNNFGSNRVMDLVGVRIEAPRRSKSVDELQLSLVASRGLKSLNRILSSN